MKKLICFFLAVIFITAMLASCQLFGPAESTATSQTVDVITDTTPSSTTVSETTGQTTAPTDQTSTTAETAATTAAETAATTATSATSATTETASTTGPTEATTEQTVLPIPPEGLKSLDFATVLDLLHAIENGDDIVLAYGDLEEYFNKYRSEYVGALAALGKLDEIPFPCLDNKDDILKDDPTPVHLVPHANETYELAYEFDFGGATGTISFVTYEIKPFDHEATTIILNEKRSVSWVEVLVKDTDKYTTYIRFKYNDKMWIELRVDNAKYDKAFGVLGNLSIIDAEYSKYTSNKPLLKRLETLCVFPTDIGSDDYDSVKDVWFGGDASDVENNRTKTFGLKAGEYYVGFDKTICGDKKLAVNVYAFDTVNGNVEDVDPAVLGNYFKSKEIETYFWNNAVTIILDKDQLDILDGIAKVPGHETYRLGFFLAALPLQKPVVTGEADGGMNSFAVIKYDFGEYTLAKSILLEMGEELSEKNITMITAINQTFYWNKLLKFYGLKDEVITGYELLSMDPPTVYGVFVINNDQLESIANTHGYIVQIKMLESEE